MLIEERRRVERSGAVPYDLGAAHLCMVCTISVTDDDKREGLDEGEVGGEEGVLQRGYLNIFIHLAKPRCGVCWQCCMAGGGQRYLKSMVSQNFSSTEVFRGIQR